MLRNSPTNASKEDNQAPKHLPGFLFFVSLFIVSFDDFKKGYWSPVPGVTTEFRLDEGSGTVASDASGNNHPGTLSGATWTAGKYGQGVNLNGSSNYINIPDHADFTLTPTLSYTWSAWVKNNNFNQWSTVWSQTINTSNFFYFYAHTSTDAEAGPVTNGVSVYWYNGNNKLVIHSNNNVLVSGQWSYVTVTYNGSLAQNSRFTIYVNGTDATNRTDVVSSGTIAAIDPTNIRVGSNQPWGEYLNGAVDEVRYYRRLLSVSEIQTDMNTGNAGDTQSPTVNITAPAAGNVSGTINVNANAADNVGVVGVQFLDGATLIGAEDITAPYSVPWNTTGVSNGSHSLTARARDAAGNTTTSAVVIVNVNNTDAVSPTVNITAPAAGNVSGTINVNANAADNVGVVGVQFLDGATLIGAEDITAPYSVPWNTTTTTNGNHNLTARARDAAGNTTTSAVVIVNVNNDITPPTVTVTPPATSPVSGIINIAATASDNIAVAGVQFFLDATTPIGAEDITAPYSVPWNTTTATNGNHNLTARARDAAGNNTTSEIVAFTVLNNNLVAAYGFNENTGTTVNDNSGNGNNGTLTNGPAWSASGRYGAAILFDGTNDFVNINDAASLDLTNGMTLEAWVNSSNLTGYKTVLCKENGTNNLSYALSPNNNTSGTANQRPNTRIRIGTTTTTVTGTTKLALNTWTHVASTYDGSVLRLYINGVQVSTANVTGSMAVSGNPLRIGGTTALAQYFTGLIDEVRIYNRALTQAQIQTDMNTPIAPDITNPAVNITAPAAGNISGMVTISANASDNISVAGVQFLLNDNPLGSEDITAPYSISWNTSSIANGPYTLIARARDGAGNTATSSEVLVTVNNDIETPTVNITAPAAGAVTGTINIEADANDNVGVAGVQFLLNNNPLGSEDIVAPYSVSWNTNTVTNDNYTLTARARDAAGNTITSSAVIVTVDNDKTVPAVTITDPAAGTIAGTVDVSADANDNIGVVGVQFLLNGANLGSEDLNAPYSIAWNTTIIPDGNYNLTARARDANGNVTTSIPVAITVKNDVTLPTVSITAPAAGTVVGTINVTANAGDNNSVAGVQFLLDENNLGAEDISAPYAVSWVTTGAGNGNHTLKARARDASGNTAISAPVIVNVNNTNLVAAYGFNENAGTVANDNSGNNNTGTLTNGPAWSASGRYGAAILFDGTNDFVNINDAASLDLTNGMTLEAWVNPSNLTGYKTVISKERTTNGYAYTMAANNSTSGTANQRPNARIRIGSNNRTVTGTNKLALNTWTHVATTYDGSMMRYFVNGVQVSTFATTGNITATTNMLRIGGSPNLGAQYFTGRIDEVRIYNRALTQTEIQTDMNTPVAPDITNPAVNITAPISGNVSGSINVTANATDNIGVAGVQFLLDGVELGTEDISAPYSVTWNTETVANGNHILTAKARDAAGNITISADVNVTVFPDFTITVTTPTRNVEVTGTTDFRLVVAYLNGFTSSSVALSFSGLPANTTGHYLLNPMSHQGETQLIITTSNAPLGTYTFDLTATAEGISHTQQVTLNITGASDFSLQTSPSIQNVTRGNAATFTINLNETNDFINPVTLSVLGLPAGVTASFNPPAPVPAATSVLTLTTSASMATGTYNLTVQGTSGAIVRTVPITLTVTDAASVWTISVIGSTGVPNNTVRVGHLKSDGLERIYVGTIATGRMLEYAWTGSSWTGPVDVGGSPSGAEIHNCTIGPGRGDGKERMYIASYDFNIYEIWNDATGWHQMLVGNVGSNLGMHTVVGIGRNDGITRLYAASTQQLFEFTWNGTSWTKVLIGSTPGAHELALGDGRRNGTNNIYIASISSGNFEARWTGTAWTIASMGDNGDARGLELGDGRNDGVIRVYSALFDGRIREFTWSGTAWTFVNMPMAGTQNVHAYIVPGRNDGINRVYTCNANGKAFEYTWNGSTWNTYNMGGGSDYLYGMHYGTGRNDGIIRFYGADRGSVNRVYEFTWGTPGSMITKHRKDNDQNNNEPSPYDIDLSLAAILTSSDEEEQ